MKINYPTETKIINIKISNMKLPNEDQYKPVHPQKTLA